MNIHDEFLAVVRSLESSGIEYAVCGGLAVAIHGFPRHTKDIDVLIRKADLDAAKIALAGIGFDLDSGLIRFKTGQPDEDRIHRVVKIEGSEILIIDLIEVTPSLNGIWEGRERYSLGESFVNVVSKDGLIAMKKKAGRPIDLADIAHLQGESSP